MTDSKWILAAIASVLFLAGCSGPRSADDWDPSDRDQVVELISDVSRAIEEPSRLAEIFTSVPDGWIDAAKGKSFELIEVEVKKDEADAKISIEDFDGNILSEQIWPCKKIDDTWKIADAPLGS